MKPHRSNSLGRVDDLGTPASYMTCEPGLPVYSSDGQELGKVEHVLAEPSLDLFDGIVLDTSVLPGGHRFVDADQVDEFFERGAVLKIDAAAAHQLPEPEKHATAMEVEAEDLVGEEEKHPKLKRAWDLISGKGLDDESD
jgi:hypothetical protein